MDPIYTIFTPARNRRHLLLRVYQSLIAQSFKSFEWVIVDDGSNDSTEELIQCLQDVAPFPIIYIYQQHSGKHIAINNAVRVCSGQFFVIVDSDDYLCSNSLQIMYKFWYGIPRCKRELFSGVSGLTATHDGVVVGKEFPAHSFESDRISMAYVHKRHGDKKGFYRVDILKMFPFPADVGVFCPESVVWYRIARAYKTLFINEVIQYVEYLSDGLTAKGKSLIISNPKGYFIKYKELAESRSMRFPINVRLRFEINCLRYGLHSHIPIFRILTANRLWFLRLILLPVAIFLYSRDRRDARPPSSDC